MSSIRSFLSFLVSLVLVVTGLVVHQAPASASTNCVPAGAFEAGEGSALNPFKISTPEHLAKLHQMTQANPNQTSEVYFLLTADVDFTESCSLPPIGSTTAAGGFAGYFDGGGHLLSNWFYFNEEISGVGLFAATESPARIERLKISGFQIRGGSEVGALIGVADQTWVNDITIMGSAVLGTGANVGGLVGKLTVPLAEPGFRIQNLVADFVGVTGTDNVGGLFGSLVNPVDPTKLFVRSGSLILSGAVEDASIGGLVGSYSPSNEGAPSLSYSGFQGDIEIVRDSEISVNAGGLIGELGNPSGTQRIESSFAKASILALIDAAPMGGLVGSEESLVEVAQSYSSVMFHDPGLSDTPRSAYPLSFSEAGSSAPTLMESFVDISVHDSWIDEAQLSGGVGVSSDALRTPQTLTDANWSVETSADVIRAGSQEDWIVRHDVELGYPILTWIYDAGFARDICQPGQFSLTGSMPCDLAPPGSFTSFSNSTAAELCPSGTFQPEAGQSFCIPAELGHYVDLNDRIEQVQCPFGTYQDEVAQENCKDPEAGRYATGLGQTTSLPCPPGTYKATQSSAGCVAADAGYSVPSPGSTSQTPCGPGSYSEVPASQTCIEAEPGHFVTGDVSREQIECNYGSFQPLPAQSGCLLAPLGRFVDERGATESIPCPAGKYQDRTGERECLLAPAGTFVASFGSASPTPCPAGTTSTEGATLCTQIGGGGGGGGGGGFVPPIPVVAPALETNPIPAGSGFAIVSPGGVVRDITPSVASDRRSFSLQVGDASLQFSAGSGLRFSDSGTATASSGTELLLAATGFEAGSNVVAYLIPTASFVSAGFKAASSTLIGETSVESDGSFELSPKIEAAAGSYVLQISATLNDGEEITMAFELLVQGDQELAVWTKRLEGNAQAKLYAKSVVGKGKVQFYFNGKEIAWVRAIDETDPKLRVITSGPMTGANYLVRTVDLLEGKNILEIYVDGERVRRTAYSR